MKDLVKINYLRDRKQALDEAESLKALIDAELYPAYFSMPLTLQFELTSRCNVKCKHCYNSSGEENAKPDRMTPEIWKSFSRSLVKNGGIFHCVISGGEPLILGDDLFEVMDILHDDGTSFLVISNGLLMTQDKAERFKKYRYKWFQISIDGVTPERHDSFRQHSGSWSAATKAVFMLSNLGIPVTIAHTVTPQNLDELDDMCDLAYSLGASNIICGTVMPSGRSFSNPEIIMNHEQRNVFAYKIDKNIQKFSGRMMVQRSAVTKVQLLRGLNTPNQGAIIRPNGDIRLDCVAPFTIGNVIDDDFFEVWGKKAGEVWKRPELLEYYESWDGEEEITTGIKNYFDADVKL